MQEGAHTGAEDGWHTAPQEEESERAYAQARRRQFQGHSRGEFKRIQRTCTQPEGSSAFGCNLPRCSAMRRPDHEI